jgi:hypothetical protein
MLAVYTWVKTAAAEEVDSVLITEYSINCDILMFRG